MVAHECGHSSRTLVLTNMNTDAYAAEPKPLPLTPVVCVPC